METKHHAKQPYLHPWTWLLGASHVQGCYGSPCFGHPVLQANQFQSRHTKTHKLEHLCCTMRTGKSTRTVYTPPIRHASLLGYWDLGFADINLMKYSSIKSTRGNVAPETPFRCHTRNRVHGIRPNTRKEVCH